MMLNIIHVNSFLWARFFAATHINNNTTMTGRRSGIFMELHQMPNISAIVAPRKGWALSGRKV
jgi:hypothetical protein